jgi:hypothetical protein
MKIILSLFLVFSAMFASADEVKYLAAVTDYGETIVFSNQACPISEDLAIASVSNGGEETLIVCYAIEEKYILIVFADGSAVRIDKAIVHVLPVKDI